MAYRIELQNVSTCKNLPSKANFVGWFTVVLHDHIEEQSAQITLRIVDEEEGKKLNKEFRQKDSATNVLAFPFEGEQELMEHYLGDIIICAPVVEKEAVEQHKALKAHYAHLFIHGVLHLLGFDHLEDEEADEMEEEEVRILAEFGFENPYEERE